MFRWTHGMRGSGASRAQNSAGVSLDDAAACIDHLHRYIELLFPARRNRKETL